MNDDIENLDRLEDRVRQLSLQSRIDLAYRRLQDYLNPATSWGDEPVTPLPSCVARVAVTRKRPWPWT